MTIILLSELKILDNIILPKYFVSSADAIHSLCLKLIGINKTVVLTQLSKSKKQKDSDVFAVVGAELQISVQEQHLEAQVNSSRSNPLSQSESHPSKV